MIKLTNEQITSTMVNYQGGQAAPNQAMESLKAKKLPVKAQYWIRRVLDKIERSFKILEDTRQELVKQHAKKDDQGNPLIIMADFKKITDKAKDIDGYKEAYAGDFVSQKTAEAISKACNISAEGNGNISIENIQDFQKDINDLMATEVDLGIDKIKIDFDVWEDSRYDVIDGKEMDLLLPMLDEI